MDKTDIDIFSLNEIKLDGSRKNAFSISKKAINTIYKHIRRDKSLRFGGIIVYVKKRYCLSEIMI